MRITAFWYSEPNRTLRVTDEDSGEYDFLNVPQEIYAGLIEAADKTAFVKDQLKDRYSWRRAR